MSSFSRRFFPDQLPQRPLGLKEPRLDGAQGHGGDGRDFLEGKIADDMEEERRALRQRQPVDERIEGLGLFCAEEGLARVVPGVLWGAAITLVPENGGGAPAVAEMLEAALVGDAEEPGRELGVVPQAPEVRDRPDEGILDDVERRLPVAREPAGIGEEAELMLAKQLVPGRFIVAAGGLDKGVERIGH